MSHFAEPAQRVSVSFSVEPTSARHSCPDGAAVTGVPGVNNVPEAETDGFCTGGALGTVEVWVVNKDVVPVAGIEGVDVFAEGCNVSLGCPAGGTAGTGFVEIGDELLVRVPFLTVVSSGEGTGTLSGFSTGFGCPAAGTERRDAAGLLFEAPTDGAVNGSPDSRGKAAAVVGKREEIGGVAARGAKSR